MVQVERARGGSATWLAGADEGLQGLLRASVRRGRLARALLARCRLVKARRRCRRDPDEGAVRLARQGALLRRRVEQALHSPARAAACGRKRCSNEDRVRRAARGKLDSGPDPHPRLATRCFLRGVQKVYESVTSRGQSRPLLLEAKRRGRTGVIAVVASAQLRQHLALVLNVCCSERSSQNGRQAYLLHPPRPGRACGPPVPPSLSSTPG